MYCSKCGAILAQGRKFCTRCGAPVTIETQGATAAPARPGDTTGQPARSSEPPRRPIPAQPPGRRPERLSPLTWGILAGFAVAIFATYLTWLSSTGPSGGSAWSGNQGRFQVADLLGIAVPIDALLVLLLSAIGASTVLRRGRQGNKPPQLLATIAVGALLTVMGLGEFLYVLRLNGIANQLGFSIGPGLGLYLFILAGIVVMVCSYQERRRIGLARGAQPR